MNGKLICGVTFLVLILHKSSDIIPNKHQKGDVFLPKNDKNCTQSKKVRIPRARNAPVFTVDLALIVSFNFIKKEETCVRERLRG